MKINSLFIELIYNKTYNKLDVIITLIIPVFESNGHWGGTRIIITKKFNNIEIYVETKFSIEQDLRTCFVDIKTELVEQIEIVSGIIYEKALSAGFNQGGIRRVGVVKLRENNE